MKPRDVILPAIKPNGKVEFPRLPVALLSSGTWTFRQRGLMLKDILDNPEPAAQIIADVNNDVHSDIVWPGSGYHNLLSHIFGGKIKFRPQGNIDVVEPAFDTIAAADKIRFDAIDKDGWICSIRDIIAGVSRLIGHECLVGTSSWGPFTLAGQFYGVEKVMSGLYRDKQGIHALLEVMTEVCYRYLAPAVARGAAILSIAEPTASGDLISRLHFEEFVAPYLGRLFARLKKDDGALITLHICGNIQDRVGLSPGLGVDLLSVDFKVDLRAAARDLDGRVALAGNVNPVALRNSSPGKVAEITRQCRELDYSRFVLMPGCDIPPSTPLENVKTFMATGAWPGHLINCQAEVAKGRRRKDVSADCGCGPSGKYRKIFTGLRNKRNQAYVRA